MSVGKLKAFDINDGKWSTYCEIVEQYFLANDVDDAKKVPILIACVGTATYELMVDLCSPKKPKDLKYDDLIELVASHIQPKPSYLAERYKFRLTKQTEGESVAQFAASLKRLATTCDFKTTLDDNLRDQFICGLKDETTRQRLFCEENHLDFKRAYKMAVSLESAAKNAATVVDKKPSSSKEDDLHAVYTAPAPGQGRGTSGARFARRGGAAAATAGRGRGAGTAARPTRSSWGPRQQCICCGEQGHDQTRCKFKEYVCKICLKKGHLKRVCPNIRDMNYTTNINMENNWGQDNGSNSNPDEDWEPGQTGDFEGLYHVELTGREPVIAEVIVDGKKLQMHVDTGSPVACINENMYKKLFGHHTLHKDDSKLRGYNRVPIQSLGFIRVSVAYLNIRQELDLHIIVNGGVPLLGREWIKPLGMSIIVTDSVLKIDKSNNKCIEVLDTSALMREHSGVFSESLGRHVSARATLRVRPDAQPVFRRARPLPLALRAPVDAELERMERAGIITPISSSDWASCLVVVVKNNGSLRICGDYKSTLNPVLEVDRYPLPRAEQLFNNLNGGKLFSKLDLKEAYMQVELSEESKKYTVVNTHRGLYMYNRLVYGVASAASIFQRVIEQVVAGIPNVTVYQDDVLITGNSEADHIKNLKSVLNRFEAAGLTLRKEKCTFFAKEVKYLGFIISENGVRMDNDKIKPILEAPAPENTSTLKSFLGMVNFYSKFIKGFTDILTPLYRLLKKGQTWEWGQPEKEAFNKIKVALTNSPVLTHYSESLPLILCCDGSQTGVGAVILHRTAEGERPIAYASRALNAAERNYSQIHREALSIVFGIKKFHTYLYGRQFTLRTDHRPLVSIFGSKADIPATAAGRLIRWALLLSGYQYDIEYVKSADNIADGLSRLPLPIVDQSDASDDCSFVQFIENNFPIRALDVKRETAVDKTLNLVSQYVKSGWPKTGVAADLLPYYRRRDELNVEGGCLIWGSRVVVPAALQAAVLAEVHGGHLGIVKCKSIARSYVWWPRIDLDIEQQCNSCRVCAETADAPPRVAIVPWTTSKKAFDRIHIDFLSYNAKSYLIVVDSYSKWIEVFPMTTTTAEATTDKLRELFARFGIPSKLISDNGPPFSSEQFASFLMKNGVTHITSAPYQPASNGEAEIAVRTIKKCLKKATKENTNPNQFLQRFLLDYRNTKHCTTDESPAALLLGRQLKTRLDLLKTGLFDTVEKNKQTKIARGPQNSRSFEVGDLVWARDFRKGHKWIEATIKQVLGNNNYKVQTEEGIISRHTNQLRARHDYGTAPTDEREARYNGVTSGVNVAPLAAAGCRIPRDAPAPPAASPRPVRARMPVMRYGFEEAYP
ncbi:uncharacterized protein K02A2.6-like [Cydia pomonella]|uniref:uncharacterized protein K02A2.6-like n=1 Tax=Cydia pomonella TaxID=82600 RepID=UPI002ADD4F69|nr:uncharacterized protein K02A2.6-like [Cydia pomonella]